MKTIGYLLILSFFFSTFSEGYAAISKQSMFCYYIVSGKTASYENVLVELTGKREFSEDGELVLYDLKDVRSIAQECRKVMRSRVGVHGRFLTAFAYPSDILMNYLFRGYHPLVYVAPNGKSIDLYKKSFEMVLGDFSFSEPFSMRIDHPNYQPVKVIRKRSGKISISHKEALTFAQISKTAYISYNHHMNPKINPLSESEYIDQVDPNLIYLDSFHFKKGLGASAVAFYDSRKKRVIIGYKGSTTISDFLLADLGLMIKNHVNFINPANYFMGDARKFFERVLKLVEVNGLGNPQIILTGHSLGGYIATYIGALFNLEAIVFSAPPLHQAVRKQKSYLSHVVNIYRKGDPVVEWTGKGHHENFIIFPRGRSKNFAKRYHSLDVTIKMLEEEMEPRSIILSN